MCVCVCMCADIAGTNEEKHLRCGFISLLQWLGRLRNCQFVPLEFGSLRRASEKLSTRHSDPMNLPPHLGEKSAKKWEYHNRKPPASHYCWVDTTRIKGLLVRLVMVFSVRINNFASETSQLEFRIGFFSGTLSTKHSEYPTSKLLDGMRSRVL